MEDLQTESRTDFVQTEVQLFTRAVLACDGAIRSVLAMDDTGRILAYERSLQGDDDNISQAVECPFLFYSPGKGILLSLHLSTVSMSSVLQNKVETAFNGSKSILTR